jgi:hypothetical protein
MPAMKLQAAPLNPDRPAAEQAFRSDVPRRPADVVIAVILGMAAIASPLFLGCSFAVARFALEATLAAVIVIWACDRRRSPWALLLPVALFAFVWLQVLPLPDSLLVWMAPISGGAWKVAQAGVPGAWGRISIDPSATAAGARRLLLGIGSFLVVRDIAANAGIRRGLAAALAVSGALIWTLGIVFPVDTKDDKVLGLVGLQGPVYGYVSALIAPVQTAGCALVTPVTVGRWQYLAADGHIGDGFGPFVGSNQFAGAMCLTLPLLLAFWLTVARRTLPAWGGVAVAAAIGAAAAWTGGIRAGSRAGGVALLIGCLAFLVLTAEKRWWRLTLAVVVACAVAAAAVLAAGTFGLIPALEAVVPERLQDALAGMLSDARWTGIRVGMRMVRASPVAGTGLDSYAQVFSRFEPGQNEIYYAHNDYVQWLAETGVVGGLLAAAFGVVFVRRAREWLRMQQGTSRVLAAGVAAAALAFASHEFFEWNLHLPAIALLAAIVAGIAAPAQPGATAAGSLFARLRIPAAIVLVAAVLASTGFLARDMLTQQAARRLRDALASNRLAQLDPKLPPPPQTAMEAAIVAGAAAAARDPANADLPLLLGQLHLHLASRAAREGDRNALEQTAEEWFTKARRRRAICFGLPEQVAPPRRSDGPTVSRPPGP